MAEYTENYNLKKPAQNEFYDVDDFNGNADLIDAAMKDLEDKKVDASGGEAGELEVTFTESADQDVTSFATLVSSIVSGMSISKFLRVIKTGLSYIAPKSHAAANKDYGGATATQYGHVKLSDVFSAQDPEGAAADSTGASQNALYNAYNTLNSKFEDYYKYPSGLQKSEGGLIVVSNTSIESSIAYTGLYYCSSITDAPTGEASTGYLMCMGYSSAFRQYIYIPYNTNKMFVRQYVNGTMTAWTQV